MRLLPPDVGAVHLLQQYPNYSDEEDEVHLPGGGGVNQVRWPHYARRRRVKCGGVTHEYGDQNGRFDDPPQSVVNHIPASVGRVENTRRWWRGSMEEASRHIQNKFNLLFKRLHQLSSSDE